MGGKSRNQDWGLIAASAFMFAVSSLLQILARKVPDLGTGMPGGFTGLW